MILLTGTSDAIQVITSTTGAVAAHASWKETTSNWASQVMGRQFFGKANTASITTATTTTVVPSPSTDMVRELLGIVVRNNHATTSNTITVQHTDGTNVVILWKGALAAAESVAYDSGEWVHYDNAGYKITATGTSGSTGATGAAGATGATGPAGPGVPAGGTTGQLLSKKTDTDYDTQWVTP